MWGVAYLLILLLTPIMGLAAFYQGRYDLLLWSFLAFIAGTVLVRRAGYE
jgi:hypothetical protein